jgi:hypothetical protein
MAIFRSALRASALFGSVTANLPFLTLHCMYYNFVRIHQTLRTTPAMAASVTKRLWEMRDIVDMPEAWEARKYESS